MLKASVSLAVGIGITSSLFFIDLVVGVQCAPSFVLSELVFLLVAAVVSMTLWQPSRDISWKPPSPSHKQKVLRAIAWMSLLASGGVFLMSYIGYRRNFPHAGWDAWAIWDLRARFLYRGGANWKDAFSPALSWSHPDYPLLLPASIARCWEYLGRETMAAVTAVQLTFGVLTVAGLGSAIAILRGRVQSALASLVLLSTPFFLRHTAAGFADVALGAYLVSALAMVCIQETASRPAFLVTAGMLAGFAAWTKNEGQLFLAALLISQVVWIWYTSGLKTALRRSLPLLAGALPALVVLAFFRSKISTTATDLFQYQSNVLIKLTDVGRYLLISKSFVHRLLDFGEWPIPMVPVLFIYGLLMGRTKRQGVSLGIRVAATALAVTLLGYFAIYVITPWADLAGHLDSSLNRLLLQLWPSALLLFFLVVRSPEECSPARPRLHAERPLLTIQFASTVILMVVIVLYLSTQIRYAYGAVMYLREVEAAISAPVYDQEIWGRIYYNPKAMIPAVRYFQSNNLSIFASERSKWLGDPITAHYKTVAADRCAGYLDDVETLAESELPGLRVRGWAWDMQLKKIAKSIVFTNRQGRIVGFGYTGFERSDVPAVRPDIGSVAVGWKGYIPGLSSGSIAAYMVTDAGRSSCLIGTREITQFTDVPFEQAGEALADIPVKIQGGWVKDGYYPGSERPPIKTLVTGSWVRSDADTGTVRLGPFRTGSCDAIALPVLTGPDSRGLSIAVIDSRSGDTVAQLRPPPILAKWRAWKIPLPKHDMQLEIVAQDQGSAWGEWLAIGMPHALR